MAKSESAHPFLHGSWEDIRLFLAVAESKSLSAAARTLQIAQPTVSRRLKELEDVLGYPLFQRHAAGAALTPEGEKLLTPARRMAELAAEIGRTSASGRTAPEGVVRIPAAPGVAFDFVAPFAAWFKTKYPGIRIELLSSVQYVDLARGEADLALRMRPPTSDDLAVVAELEHANRVFVSREYSKTLPKKFGFADVAWIAWAPPFQDVPPNPQLESLIPNFRPAFTTDNFLVMTRAAEEGLGAVILGDVRHRFARETPLVPLKLDLGPHGRSELYLVSAKRGLESTRVRVVAEALRDELARIGR